MTTQEKRKNIEKFKAQQATLEFKELGEEVLESEIVKLTYKLERLKAAKEMLQSSKTKFKEWYPGKVEPINEIEIFIKNEIEEQNHSIDVEQYTTLNELVGRYLNIHDANYHFMDSTILVNDKPGVEDQVLEHLDTVTIKRICMEITNS